MKIRIDRKRLSRLIAERGLTYREIDRKAGRKVGWMGQKMKLLRANPTVMPKTAKAIAKGVRCKLEDIVDLAVHVAAGALRSGATGKDCGN